MTNNENKVKETVKDEVKVVDYSKVLLKIENYVKKDPEISKIISTNFEDLSSNDLKKLCLCKAKVETVAKTRYVNGKTETYESYQLSIQLTPALVLKKRINELELNLIRMLCPELISKKAQVSIPLKLIHFIDKNGKKGYRYIAYVCPGVYVKEFFFSTQLTTICVSNLQSENKIYFYEVDYNLVKSLTENEEVIHEDDF